MELSRKGPRAGTESRAVKLVRQTVSIPEMGVLIPLVIFIVLFSMINPAMLSRVNITVIMRTIAFTGVVAVGMSFLIIAGEIDLSVGSVAGLGAIVSGWMMKNAGWPVPAAVVAGLLTGGLCGLVDLALVDVRDVGSNIYLGREPRRLGILIDFPKMYADARAVLNVLRINMPSVKVNVGELSGGQRQAVAIARSLARGRNIFLMDEPTAALGVEQRRKVQDLIADLRAQGKTVVVISHDLEHVFEIADRVIVLRLGQRVGTRARNETTKEEIVGLITGAIRGDVA